MQQTPNVLDAFHEGKLSLAAMGAGESVALDYSLASQRELCSLKRGFVLHVGRQQ